MKYKFRNLPQSIRSYDQLWCASELYLKNVHNVPLNTIRAQIEGFEF